MEQIECSETLAYKIQTPGNHPEENIQHTEHGESLKSKKDFFLSVIHKLPDRWRKYIANQGDYVGKQQFQIQRIIFVLFTNYNSYLLNPRNIQPCMCLSTESGKTWPK
jgi:hypothetical protein